MPKIAPRHFDTSVSNMYHYATWSVPPAVSFAQSQGATQWSQKIPSVLYLCNYNNAHICVVPWLLLMNLYRKHVTVTFWLGDMKLLDETVWHLSHRTGLLTIVIMNKPPNKQVHVLMFASFYVQVTSLWTQSPIPYWLLRTISQDVSSMLVDKYNSTTLVDIADRWLHASTQQRSCTNC